MSHLNDIINFLKDNDISFDDVEFIAGYKEVHAWFPEVENIEHPDADENGVIDQETGIELEDSTGDSFIVNYFSQKYNMYYEMELGFSM